MPPGACTRQYLCNTYLNCRRYISEEAVQPVTLEKTSLGDDDCEATLTRYRSWVNVRKQMTDEGLEVLAARNRLTAPATQQ